MIKKLGVGLLAVWMALTALTTGVVAAPDGTDRTGVAEPFTTLLAQEHNGHYYKYFSSTMSRAGALNFCQEQGGHLVTISDAEENELVRRLFAGKTGSVWIGGDDLQTQGSFTWVTGEPFAYTNWQAGEPDNEAGTERHIRMFEDGGWDDYGHDQLAFVCEWEPGTFEIVPAAGKIMTYGDNSYGFFALLYTWEMAALTCQRMGGHLVTLTSEAEHQFVWNMVYPEDVWLGATDVFKEGRFEWITGETFVYRSWAPGEPSNSGGNQSFVHMYTTGGWDDQSPTDQRYFVCEWNGICQTETGFAETHTFSDWQILTNPDCHREGERSHICVQCGFSETEILPKLAHPYGEWEEIQKISCGSPGRRKRTCAMCGLVETQTEPAWTHQFTDYRQISGSVLIPPIVKERTCELCHYSETVEDWSCVWVTILAVAAVIGVVLGVINYAKAFKKK